MLGQLTLSVGAAPVLTTSLPAAAARHYFAEAGAPGLLADPTVHKFFTYTTQQQPLLYSLL